MKKVFPAIITLTLFYSSLSSARIVIDGDMADWSNVETIASDPPDDISKPGTDILEFRVWNDLKNLYFYSKHSAPMLPEDGPDGGQGRYYWLVFIDLDQSLETGINPNEFDARCYAPSEVGCDFEIIFERDHNDRTGNFDIQYAFGNGAVGFYSQTQTSVLNGVLYIGGSHDPAQQVSYKFLTESIPSGIVLTRDLNKNPAPGQGVLMHHAFSEDMTEVEVSVDFKAALKGSNGIAHLAIGKTIDIGFACESSPWDPCGDGIEAIKGYSLLPPPTNTPTPTMTPTPSSTVTPTPTIACIQSATLLISNAAPFPNDQGEFRLRFLWTDEHFETCEQGFCPVSHSLVQCEIDCTEFIGMTDPARIVDAISEQVGESIREQSLGHMTSIVQEGQGVLIRSEIPFQCCLCSEETANLCELNQGHPLSVCPIYNLCDGIPGNETNDHEAFAGGIGLKLIDGPCWEGSTATPTPTHTQSQTPTPTCELPSILLDGGLETTELFELLKSWREKAIEPVMDLNCDGVLDERDIWIACVYWKGL